MKRRNLLAAALILFLLAPTATALAHALPIQSLPEANAQLDESPAQVEIFFSERLDPSFSEIKVFDTNGNQVDNRDSAVDPADPTRLTVSVRSLGDGVYTVVWKVLSTVDGHITSGAYPFAVGDVDAAALAEMAAASQKVEVTPFDILSRWLIFASGASFLGMVVFPLAAWLPAEPTDELKQRASVAWRVLGIAALAVFVGGNLLNVMAQVGNASEKLIGWPWQATFGPVIFATRTGAIIFLRVLAAFGLLAILGRDDQPATRWTRLGLSALVLLTISLTSHSAATEHPLVPTLADWLHLLAVGVWVGGLMTMGAALWAAREGELGQRAQFLSRLMPRFTRLALPSVGIIVLTGLYSAVPKIGTFENLVNSAYGQSLLVKLTLFAPLLALGASNLLLLTPRMKRAATGTGADTTLARCFRFSVTAEITLSVLVLLAVTFLTTIPPAATTAALPSLDAEGEADDLDVALDIAPGRVGVNTFTVTVTRDEEPLDDALEVSLQFTPTTSAIPPTEVTLENKGGGEYAIEGAYLSQADTWQVQVAVRRSDAFDAFANLSFDVGVARQSSTFAWSRVTGLLLVALGFGFFMTRPPLKLSPDRALAFSVASAVTLVLAGIVVYARPVPQSDTLEVNPVPPNADSVAAGEALYAQNCVPCHGVSGRGDGPVGLTLNPSPADLTIHTAPGVHPDGQLFEWISDGFPGSNVMPAFRSQLSDEDRWNLVNYLRTLAQ